MIAIAYYKRSDSNNVHVVGEMERCGVQREGGGGDQENTVRKH